MDNWANNLPKQIEHLENVQDQLAAIDDQNLYRSSFSLPRAPISASANASFPLCARTRDGRDVTWYIIYVLRLQPPPSCACSRRRAAVAAAAQ